MKRFEWLIAALVLALLTLAMFHPLLQGRWLEGDVAEEYWPDLVVLCRGLAEHHIPRWLPFEHGGTPFYADPQAGVYYPLNHAMCMLAGPAPSIHWADARVVVHFFIAGACMTAFLRLEKLGLPASLFGGALFEMSPFFRHDWELNLTSGFAWFPLVLLAISAMCREPTMLRGAFVALSVALVVSVGSPPAAFFALLGAAFFAIFRVTTALRAGANRRVMTRAILATLVTAACVLPMMLVPTWELTRQSVQSAHDFSVTSDGGDAHVLGVLVPWLDDHHYVSIFAVVLAPFAFLGAAARRWPLRWFFAGLALFALFMIAGTHTPFYRLAYAIVPGVSLFRDPTRYSSLWGASLAALAAAGFDQRVWTRKWLVSIAFVVFAFVDLRPYFVADGHTRAWPVAENRTTEESLHAIGADVTRFRTYDEFGIGMRSGSRYMQRDLRGYQDPLTIGRYGKMLGMLETKPELLGTFNVRWVLYGPHYMMGDWHHFIPDPAKGTWATARAPHVWEIPNALPDAFFMDGAEIAKDQDDALDRLAAVAPAPKIVLENEEAPKGTGTYAPAEAIVDGERVTVDVDAPAAGFVLVNETFYPGWIATIDGAPAPVLRANAFVRALRVAPGQHHIVMEFRPWEPRVLEPLALAMLAVIGAAVCVVLVRRTHVRVVSMLVLVGCASSSPPPAVTVRVAPTSPPAITAAAPPPAYPWRWHTHSAAEVDAIKAELATKNAGAWSLVNIRTDGLAFQLESSDPAIVQSDPAHPNDFSAADLARWDAFLERNAALFGILHPQSAHLTLVPLGRDPTPNVAELRQYVGALLVAGITFAKRPNGIAIDGALWPMDAAARVTDESIQARFVGKSYDEASTWTALPPLDCSMSPHPSCNASPLGTVTTKVTADRAHVGVTHRIVDVPKGDGWFEKRHVVCVALKFPPVDVHADMGLRTSAYTVFTPIDDAPKLPLAIDAVTGETIDHGVCP